MHRSLSTESDLSSPTKRFSLDALGSDGRERTFSGGDELPLIRFFIGRAQVWYRF
jgi:hypothetical protein